MSGIVCEIKGNTAVVSIANPPANTWTKDSLDELGRIVETLNNNTDVYALVLTGEGEKFFSAGADLNQFSAGDKGVAATLAATFGKAFTALANFRGVSIAAINGYAMGGGLEAAMACDIRIIEAQAQVALPEAKVGLLPCGLGTQTLTRLVGEPWAKRMILCGERITAEKALEIGLAEEVVEKGNALSAAMQLAGKVGEQSPVSVRFSKNLIQGTRNSTMEDVLFKEREAFVALFDYADTTEGVNAFLEKRSANWKNK